MKTPMICYDNIGRNQEISKSMQSEVEHVIVKLNDRPRKKLNYKTPAKLMAEDMVAIAA